MQILQLTTQFSPQILGNNLALGDPGFQGVNYVVAGFKSSQLSTLAQFAFDTFSRSEQVLIEHVNSFY